MGRWNRGADVRHSFVPGKMEEVVNVHVVCEGWKGLTGIGIGIGILVQRACRLILQGILRADSPLTQSGCGQSRRGRESSEGTA